MPRPHARPHRSALQVEHLEDRTVPAGNVSVTQIGTELRVIGDAAANNFTILGRGPGVVEIRGHGTTVNGGSAKVTVTGVEWLRVAGRANDDVIKTRDLEIAQVNVFGEGGNDVLELSGTRGVDLPSYYYDDRGLDLGVSGGSGDDTIRIIGTEVEGNFASIGIEGNDGRNDITIDDTRVEPVAGGWGGFLYLYVYGEFTGVPRVGDTITIDHLQVEGVAPDSEPYLGWIPWSVNIYGGDADEAFRLRNWDLSARGSDTDIYGDTYVYGAEGTDRIEVENVSMSLSTPAGIGRNNQLLSSFDADQVMMRNVRHEGGVFDGTGSWGSVLSISTAEADLRNVMVISATGYASLGLYSPFEDSTRAASFTLANVTISGGGAGGFTDVYTGDGNDSFHVTNSELGSVGMNLGEGNDTLTFVNVGFNVPRYVFGEFEYGGMFTGGGDDTVSFTNCDGETVHLDTGDGDDTVSLTNCAFLAADLFGGDGDDELNLTNNTGLFNFDGFEL